MKLVAMLMVAVLSAPGCGRPEAPISTVAPFPRSPQAAEKPAAAPAALVWNPALIEGGYMFRDADQFAEYVRGAQLIATGVLTAWDGRQGVVRLDSVLQGRHPDRSVAVVATGGLVRPKVNERVLFLLAPRDGALKLHSFCGAAGLYNESEELTQIVKRALAKQ